MGCPCMLLWVPELQFKGLRLPKSRERQLLLVLHRSELLLHLSMLRPQMP